MIDLWRNKHSKLQTRFKLFRRWILRHRLICGVAATALAFGYGLIGLDQEWGPIGLFSFIAIACAWLLFLQWLMPERKREANATINIDEPSDVLAAAREMARSSEDEHHESILTTADLNREPWGRLLAGLARTLQAACAASGATLSVDHRQSSFHRSGFTLIKDNQRVQIVISKREFDDSSELRLATHREVTVTMRRLLPSRRTIVLLPMAVALLLVVVGITLGLDDGLFDVIFIFACAFALFGVMKRLEKQKKRNSQAFSDAELAALLSAASGFLQAELNPQQVTAELSP